MDKPFVKFRLVFRQAPSVLKSAEYDIYPVLKEINQNVWTAKTGMSNWPKIAVPEPDREVLYD